MIKTDDMYLENLKELLYDDKRVVTYKYLSVFLGVHVNLAKQMLYTFYEKEKKSGKKLYALFYVSGLVREKAVAAAEDSNSPGEETERQVILLCRDEEYEEIKKSFSRLYSVHIYCLSAHPIPDISALQPVVGDTLRIGEEQKKSVIEYGPFSLTAEIKPFKVTCTGPTTSEKAAGARSVKSEPAETSSKGSTSSEKAEIVKREVKTDSAKTKSFFGSQKANGTTATKSPAQAGASKAKSSAHQSSLQASFGKTKPVSKPKESEEKKPAKETKVFKATQGRKRIRVESESGSDDDDRDKKKQHPDFTSSDDDDDENDSENETSDMPRPSRIDSDSEEEPEKPASPVSKPSANAPVSRDGRKRSMKTVTKTYEDEDGYTLTVKEYVVVSESDEESSAVMETDSTPSVVPNGKPTDVKQEAETTDTPVPKEQTSEASKKKAAAAGGGLGLSSAKGRAATTGSQPKSKQASIMSFFQKK